MICSPFPLVSCLHYLGIILNIDFWNPIKFPQCFPIPSFKGKNTAYSEDIKEILYDSLATSEVKSKAFGEEKRKSSLSEWL